MLAVREISRDECKDLVLNIHYAKRWPSVSYRFGLYDGDSLEGVVTFGTPCSSTLRNGVAGKDEAHHVIELNRLVLYKNKKNHASFLVSAAMRELRKKGNFIVVSFADTEQGHLGVVYQAANFDYFGLSAKRTDWKVRGLEHLHGQTIADEFRGVKNRSQAMRDKYGDDFYLAPRPRKHRYIYVIGGKQFKKRISGLIRYKKENYPKRET